jgi:PAS domain S-box-containing protein
MTEPLNVLIVEDNPDDAELAVAALRHDGFAPDWRIAATRDEFLAHLNPDLDVILADYTLPTFDAPTALRLLNESGLDVPFIVISGTVGEEAVVALMRQGAADYLLKDRLARLGEAVRRALAGRALQQEARSAEMALMASEARFRRLAENAPDIIYRWRVTGPMGFEYISPAVEAILGYPVDKFYENPRFLLAIVHPDDRDLMAQMLTGERPFEPVTVRVRHQDGSTVWLERRSAPVRTEDGDVVASEGIIRDVTARKRMEGALRKSRARLQAIFDNAQDAILVMDDEMRFLNTNQAACKLLGYEREELLSRAIKDITFPADVRHVAHLWRQYLKTGALSGEFVLRRKNDSAIITEYRAVAHIEPGINLAIVHDITERKEAEEALRESEEKYRDLFSSIRDAILVVGMDRQVIDCNPAFTELFGYTLDEIRDLNTSTLYTSEAQYEEIDIALRRHVDDPSYLYTVNYKTKSGGVFPGETNVFYLRDDAGDAVGYIKLVRDITERRAAEEALRRSEGRFRQLFETAPIPLLMIGAADRTVLAANERFADAVEVPVEDLIGRDLLSLEDFKQVDLPLDRMTQEPVRDYELHIRADRSGHVVWLLLSSEPILLEGGRAILASFQSITPLKEAQQAERAQREFAEALSANALDIHRTLSLEQTLNRLLDNVRSVMAFDTATVMLVERDKLVYAAQTGYAEMDAESELEANYGVNELASVQQALETGEPVWDEDVAASGRWHITPGMKWMRSFVTAPIVRDGGAIGVLGLASRKAGAFSEEDAAHLRAFSAQAATAIVNARLYEELEDYSEILEQAVQDRTAELERAKDQAQSILNHSPDPILLLGTDGAVRAGNMAFRRLFGYELDDLYGRWLREFIVPEQHETLLRVLDATWEKLEPARLEVTAIDKKGGSFDTHLSLSPISRGGAISGVVCSFHDISALKEVQRMKDEFVSTATHELRTPLTSVKGFSELLLTRELNAERQTRYIHLIHDQATHLAFVIDDMLDLSKLTAGKGLDIEPEPVDLGPLVREVLDTFRDVSPAHTFHVRGCESLPTVPGDPFRLNQVLRNLVSNAVKYSPTGGPVTVACRVLDEHLLVSVSDAGIGITDEQQSHLFEEFYRADHAIKGTGLGLRISQLIVLGHGGWMWAESEYGAGSTFYFVLPLERE